jgi:hypothetical protein
MIVKRVSLAAIQVASFARALILPQLSDTIQRESASDFLRDARWPDGMTEPGRILIISGP